MSTFDGFLPEFPYISIDYFRPRIGSGRPAPTAYFLSHIHSDHLVGLESFHSPFIYCSSVTRELLLKLEKYGDRMDHHNEIIQKPKRRFKHLKRKLKSIPLNTPTKIELGPNRHIRVTLLEANHCPGAVMFLVQGDAKTILYTGDIRAEKWWVDALVRNPIILPYAYGSKRIDKVYLDTTFASRDEKYRQFPSKADGVAELLSKVLSYPSDTVFHLHAWTFGYEDVWITLSNELQSQIHLEDYRLRLYASLANPPDNPNACQDNAVFTGFKLANHNHEGCLTREHNVRLHSCEFGFGCPASTSERTVFITPIMNRGPDGRIMYEAGAGGGQSGFAQSHDLDSSDEQAVDENVRNAALKVLPGLLTKFDGKFPFEVLDLDPHNELINLQVLFERLAQYARTTLESSEKDVVRPTSPSVERPTKQKTTNDLPARLDFPYARHSSYEELCHLIKAFQPKDIYPCTFRAEDWSEDTSISSLFGDICGNPVFSYDEEMRVRSKERAQAAGNHNTIGDLRVEASTVAKLLGLAGPKRKAPPEDPPIGERFSSHLPLDDDHRAKRSRSGSTDSAAFLTPDDAAEGTSAMSPGTAVAKLRSHFNNHLAASRQSESRKSSTEGTKAVPIDISDDEKQSFVTPRNDAADLTQQDASNHTKENKAGEDSAEQARTEDEESQDATETQITLSDTAFESQDFGPATADGRDGGAVEHRKEAYMLVRDGMRTSRELELGLVSAGEGHRNEEMEL